MGKEVVTVFQGRLSRARWSVGQAKSSVQQAELLAADVKGDQHGVEKYWCVEFTCLSSGLEPASVIP